MLESGSVHNNLLAGDCHAMLALDAIKVEMTVKGGIFIPIRIAIAQATKVLKLGIIIVVRVAG
jgi:hypothetical protein